MIALAVFAVSCSSDPTTSQNQTKAKATEEKTGGWLCMFYLDLSDLPGLSNLNEICSIDATNLVESNCVTYIMTGGAKTENAQFTQSDYPALYTAVDGNTDAFVGAETANSYQYWKLSIKNGKFHLDPVTWTSKAMSDSTVLYDFMDKCYTQTSDAASRQLVLNLWNHGGGSYQGLLWDHSISSQPGMTLSGLKTALSKFKTNHNGEVLECINFDMCLMSSAETVYTLYNDGNLLAKYMVASEPTAAGRGSSYTDWFTFLYSSENKATTGQQFAETFCETAIKACSQDNDDQDPGAVWSAINVNGWKAFNDTYYATFLTSLKDKINATGLIEMRKNDSTGSELSKAQGKGSELYTNGMYDIYQVSQKFGVTLDDNAFNGLIIKCYIDANKGLRGKDGLKLAKGLSMCILTSDDASSSDKAYKAYIRDCVSPETKTLYNTTLEF